MVFVCVREDNAANVGDSKPRGSQSVTKCCTGFFGLWTCVDDGDRIFGDEVDVYRSDVEGGWDGNRYDLHTAG